MSTLSCAVCETLRERAPGPGSPRRVWEASGVASGEPDGLRLGPVMRPASPNTIAPPLTVERMGGKEGENVEESGIRVWGGMRWWFLYHRGPTGLFKLYFVRIDGPMPGI